MSYPEIPESERARAAKFLAIVNLGGQIPKSINDVESFWTRNVEIWTNEGVDRENLDFELQFWQTRIERSGGQDDDRRNWGLLTGRVDPEDVELDLATREGPFHPILEVERRGTVRRKPELPARPLNKARITRSRSLSLRRSRGS